MSMQPTLFTISDEEVNKKRQIITRNLRYLSLKELDLLEKMSDHLVLNYSKMYKAEQHELTNKNE